MNVLYAFLLTLFAGLSTGIGGLLAFHKKASSKRFLAFSLGFSAGVMIYVSFLEIFPKALDDLVGLHGDHLGYIYTTLAFFIGIGFIGLIDWMVPSRENPHEIPSMTKNGVDFEKTKLMRMGLFSALAIALHNFPEGLATFVAAVQNPQLGIGIAIAIAIHNIPEGIAVAVPIFQATGSKRKAFTYSLLSGLAEPVGALIGYYLIITLVGDINFGFIFAFVAGIMVYISLDELLPSAEKFGEHHLSILGLILGFIVMALSLILFI